MEFDDEMKLRAQGLEDWIARLALAIEDTIFHFGERADSNAFAQCTALDIVKERIEAELKSRGRKRE